MLLKGAGDASVSKGKRRILTFLSLSFLILINVPVLVLSIMILIDSTIYSVLGK